MRAPFCATLALALIASPVAAAAAYKPPRMPFGAPDLQGLWTNTALTMLERPAAFKAVAATDQEADAFEAMFVAMISQPPDPPDAPAPPKVKSVQNSEWAEMDLHLARVNGQRRSSWIVDPPDGKIPFTDAGRKARDAAADDTFDGPEGRPLTERCLAGVGSPDGPPMMNSGYNGDYQIVQTPDHVAIVIEMVHEVRDVRMGDRRHASDAIRPWLGDSVGWYEGDTLVVETTNFDPRTYVTSLGGMGGAFTYSAKAKLTERFTRTSPTTMLYAFEVDDPVNFTRRWRGEMPWRTAAGPLYEYACHEGNYSLPLALSGARVQEAAAAKAAR